MLRGRTGRTGHGKRDQEFPCPGEQLMKAPHGRERLAPRGNSGRSSEAGAVGEQRRWPGPDPGGGLLCQGKQGVFYS